MTSDDGRRPIRRALISVYDKTGLAELARGLHDAGVAIVSTGSDREETILRTDSVLSRWFGA